LILLADLNARLGPLSLNRLGSWRRLKNGSRLASNNDSP
jgi:hypothetical protein